MVRNASAHYFKEVDKIPRDYEAEFAYNFLDTFHTLKPEFVKDTCWEQLHAEAIIILFRDHKGKTNQTYLLWLAERVCKISNEKDFVGLYKKYTSRADES